MKTIVSWCVSCGQQVEWEVLKVAEVVSARCTRCKSPGSFPPPAKTTKAVAEVEAAEEETTDGL